MLVKKDDDVKIGSDVGPFTNNKRGKCSLFLSSYMTIKTSSLDHFPLLTRSVY